MIKKTKAIFLIYFLLAGLFLFPSCKQKQKTNETITETQIENAQEEQVATDIKTDSEKKRTFHSEHPVLFTIIILAILITIFTITMLVKSSCNEVSNTMIWVDRFKKFRRN